MANKQRLLSDRVKVVQETYRWKSENIVRFFEHLGMTTEEKVEYLAREFAYVHLFSGLYDAHESVEEGKRD